PALQTRNGADVEPPAPDWAYIARALQAPFADGEVKTKPRDGKQFSYIDARAVAARLDAVVGPQNWAFVWEAMVIDRPPALRKRDGTELPRPDVPAVL